MTQKTKTNKNFNITINKLKEFSSNNTKLLKFITVIFIAFFTIFLFVMAMIPTNPGFSNTKFVFTNPMYAIKFVGEFSSYIVIFSPAGWVVLVLTLCAIVLITLTIMGNLEGWKVGWKNSKIEKEEKKYWINWSIYFALLASWLALLLFNLIPPNYPALLNYYGSGGGTLPTSNNGSFWFTPNSWFSNGVTVFVGGYIAIIVIFVTLSSYFVIGLFVEYILRKMPNIKTRFVINKEAIEKFKEKRIHNKEAKLKIKHAQKMLEQEESELLKDLYINSPVKENKGDLSQEELQEKIKKNNEIKKQLDEINKQKNEMRLQRNKLSKFRSAIDEMNSKKMNLRNNKKEKQKITIPDKELDEIFKSLEID